MLKAFAVDGGNGSYIEFSNGEYVDTVAGDMDVSFFVDAEEGPYNSAINYANENCNWVTKRNWKRWSNWDNGIQDIEEYVGA